MKIDLSVSEVLDALTYQEFLSTPLLTEEERIALLVKARAIHFKKLPPVITKSMVMQEMEMGSVPEIEITAHSIVGQIVTTLNTLFADVEPYLFEEPLAFNEYSILRYQIGGGNSPHIEGPSFKNLIGLVVLEGRGELYVCKNRAGDDAVRVPCPPGQLVLMPAHGYMERDDTPFHYLTNVTSERYVLGLRQKFAA